MLELIYTVQAAQLCMEEWHVLNYQQMQYTLLIILSQGWRIHFLEERMNMSVTTNLKFGTNIIVLCFSQWAINLFPQKILLHLTENV